MPSLMAVLGLDVSPFDRGLIEAKGTASRRGKEIGGNLSGAIQGALAGFAGAAGIKRVFDDVVSMAEDAHEKILAGAKLGIDPAQFEQLDKAAKKFGSSGAEVGMAFKKIAVASIGALDGNLEMEASFKTLGVTMADLKNKSVDKIFEQITRNMQGGEATAARLTALIRTMGKAADELVPAIKAGAFSKMDVFGHTNAELDAAEKFGKDIGVFKKAWNHLYESALSPDANKDGAISRLIHWTAGKIRGYYGMPEETRVKPMDLKTVSVAELRAEGAIKTKAVKDLEEQRKLEMELFQIKQAHALKLMTDEQKLMEIKRQIKAIADFVNTHNLTPANRIRAAIDIEKLIDRAEDLVARKQRPERMHADVNPLQRIGAYAELIDPGVDVARKSHDVLKSIDKRLEAIAGKGPQGGQGVLY